MSNANITLNDLGLTSKSSGVVGASGCGGDCNCTCGADESTLETTSATVNGIATAEYLVTGMTCSHCVLSVTEEMFDLDGVQNVSVELVVGGNSTVTVSSAAPLALDEVRAAITVAGYELVPAV